MIKDDSPRPKIRHTTIAKDMTTFRGVLVAFADEVEKAALADLKKTKKTPWLDESDGNLVAQRKKLLELAKQGVRIGGPDIEEQIALQAAIVWFLRLDRTRKNRIMGELG